MTQIKILKTPEVADMLRVSEDYIRHLCRDRKIRCYKEGKRGGFRFLESDVEDYVRQKMRSNQ